MEELFIDVDFEPGMGFLVDILTKCIENRIHGFINEKGENFSVQFCFLGFKVNGAKRKVEEEVCSLTNKKQKLHVSLENLTLCCVEDGGTDASKYAGIENAGSMSIKVEVESNAAGCSGLRKRVIDQNEGPKAKIRRKNLRKLI